MLAGHPRLLLFEFDLLPVLVGGPFAQNLRCIIWDFVDRSHLMCILDFPPVLTLLGRLSS